LVCPGDEHGGAYFDYELRKKFDTFDTSRDGVIGFPELVLFLKGELKNLTTAVSLCEQEKLKEVFETLARDCMIMLHEAAGQKGVKVNPDSEIGWGLFKMINKVCKKKIETTGNFITHFFDKH
jgi:hypothetical protein